MACDQRRRLAPTGQPSDWASMCLSLAIVVATFFFVMGILTLVVAAVAPEPLPREVLERGE